VQAAANQLGKSTFQISQKISGLRTNLAALAPAASKDTLAAELAQVADQVKSELDKHERLKVWILRTIAAIIGCVLVGQSEFHVFRILAESPDAKAFLGALTKLQDPWINIFTGGFAAAAGSSYWHDQLDRVRKLKTIVSEAKSIGV
jgi:hypothetical protein